MMKPLEQLVRPNILQLAPYSSARNEYSGHEATVFLDANENPYNEPYNRYPDPLQLELKQKLSALKGLSPECIFLGNGSDEAIDLPYRIFCEPGIDNAVAIEPTYGMYRVCADINNVEYRPVELGEGFSMNADKLLAATDEHTKLIWICTPNNPTGNNMNHDEIRRVIENFDGIVIVDEAYADFTRVRPIRLDVPKYGNLIVLNTLSKAWGCAALRLGMAFAQPPIIDLFNKVKYPYNVNLLTQQKAIEIITDQEAMEKHLSIILGERERVMAAFQDLSFCKKVYPTDANFFLARMDNAQKIYDYLISRGIVVRNRTHVTLCHDCLRVTIGKTSENQALLAALRQY